MENLYERFLGYADTYDEGRPKLPETVFETLKIYKEDIDTIVDIGCGTGLSTEVCTKYANNVIGIEPSIDMLNMAKTKENDKMHFYQGFGNNTGLEDNYADIVICSQAFHWMEPKTTIKEIYRILKKGGIFAIIDAEYPPTINAKLEKLYIYLHQKTANLEGYDDNKILEKLDHLNNIRKSNLFTYIKEIYFSNIEKYDKERFKKFIFSQSSMQKAIKNNFDIMKQDIEILDKELEEIFEGKSLKAIYSYKMKIGIKE